MRENINTLAKQIADKENIENYKLVLKESGSKGDGYLGMIRFGKIIGSNKTMNVVFKCRHPNCEFLPELISRIYRTEISFYETIAPSFTNFQNEYDVLEPFDNTAKLYGSLKETFRETLALEDLKVDNYLMWGRQQLMNEDHLKLALKTFAKFHGTSFAMKQLKPELYTKLSENLIPDIFSKAFEDMYMYPQVAKAIKEIQKIFKGKQHYVDLLENFAANIQQMLEDAFKYDEHNVIIQGDCWCTNALYKYNDANEMPTDMKMLDFQMIKLGSPALDVSYFLYAAAPKEHLDNLDEFLKFYYNELKNHLGKFDLEVKKLFSYDDLTCAWRKVAVFALGMSIMVKKVMLVESQDAPDIVDNTDDFFDKMTMTPMTKSLYDQQIKDLVEHFVERKFI